MQKITFKKLSILGFVLMVASALVSAIVPFEKSNKQLQFSLSMETKDGNESSESCIATVAAEDDPCEDDSETFGDFSGSTDEDEDGSDGPTTII